MKQAFLKSLLVLTGALLFNIIFWQEKMGLNLLIFDAFILWSVFYLYPSCFSNAVVKWLLLAHAITMATVLIHNTELSKLAFDITLLTLIVFVQYAHRSVWYAAGSSFMNYALMIPSFITDLGSVKVKSVRFYSISKVIRILIIPFLLVAVFFMLYSFSNAVFKDMMGELGDFLQRSLYRLFDWFNWQRFGFILLGLYITGGLLLKSKVDYFSRKDISQQDYMLRRKWSFAKWKDSVSSDLLSLFMGKFSRGNMALKNENTVGIISMAMLNLLLLCINCIDIVYVWFGFQYNNKMNLSDYVHEGTWILIFSIVLAMAVLLFFFRGNLNFYKKNKWLRYGAYGWIVQNIILVFSVLLRDYYYILHCGLAYKRIGVLFFLMMVLAGLITVSVKIYQRKTRYYLLRVNAWVAMGLLVLASCVHWDELIANYNIAHRDSISLDVKFLLSLSDKALPVIEQHQDILNQKIASDDSTADERSDSAPLTAKELFELRKKTFFEAQQNYSWLSWNMSDAYAKKYLPVPVSISSKINK
jgi:uncharacterized protein DUF4153